MSYERMTGEILPASPMFGSLSHIIAHRAMRIDVPAEQDPTPTGFTPPPSPKLKRKLGVSSLHEAIELIIKSMACKDLSMDSAEFLGEMSNRYLDWLEEQGGGDVFGHEDGVDFQHLFTLANSIF